VIRWMACVNTWGGRPKVSDDGAEPWTNWTTIPMTWLQDSMWSMKNNPSDPPTFSMYSTQCLVKL
jgi:hypothetical protein